MRKIKVIIIAALCVCVLPLCACRETVEEEAQSGRLVVASFYPMYALTAPILKGVPDTELRCLVQPQDGCLRDYSLSEWDVALLSLCDVAVLGGRGLEKFESVLMRLEEGPVVISAMSGLTLIDEDQSTEDDEQGHSGANPWLFLSVGGAGSMAEQIAASFCYVDPGNEETYSQNLNEFLDKLSELKAEIEELLNSSRDTPIALLHEGLVYFAQEYELNIQCIVEREPLSDYNLDEIEALTLELKDSGVSVVLIERQAPTRLKKDLEEAGFQVCSFDTLSTHIADGDADGYASAMLNNARALKDAYGRAGV